MPQLRQMPNGQTRIRFHRPENRMARTVAKYLRYVAAKRDSDDMLTADAGAMAERLEALCDALAKPQRPKKPEVDPHPAPEPQPKKPRAKK